MRQFKESLEFEWDSGNIDKNKKHDVKNAECEEIFFDKNKVVLDDLKHSVGTENRFILLGKTKKGRLLYTVFTTRGKKLRIISCRDINKKEVKLYEETI